MDEGFYSQPLNGGSRDARPQRASSSWWEGVGGGARALGDPFVSSFVGSSACPQPSVPSPAPTALQGTMRESGLTQARGPPWTHSLITKKRALGMGTSTSCCPRRSWDHPETLDGCGGLGEPDTPLSALDAEMPGWGRGWALDVLVCVWDKAATQHAASSAASQG